MGIFIIPSSAAVVVLNVGSTILIKAMPLGTVPVVVPNKPNVRSKSLLPPMRLPKYTEMKNMNRATTIDTNAMGTIHSQ